MGFIFKAIGFVLGLRYFGGRGAVLGFLVGHIVDVVIYAKLGQACGKRMSKRLQQAAFNERFLVSLYSMFAKLAVADGAPCPAEVAAVREISKGHLHLSRAGRKFAEKVFEGAKYSTESFQIHAARCYDLFREQPRMLAGLLQALFALAASDGPIQKAEEQLLRTAARIFELSEDSYVRLASQYTFSSSADRLTECYKVLGCDRTASLEEVKRCYRKLVSDFHPDKIMHKDLPEEFIRFAETRFNSIKLAYETLLRASGGSGKASS